MSGQTQTVTAPNLYLQGAIALARNYQELLSEKDETISTQRKTIEQFQKQFEALTAENSFREWENKCLKEQLAAAHIHWVDKNKAMAEKDTQIQALGNKILNLENKILNLENKIVILEKIVYLIECIANVYWELVNQDWTWFGIQMPPHPASYNWMKDFTSQVCINEFNRVWAPHKPHELPIPVPFTKFFATVHSAVTQEKTLKEILNTM